MSEFLHDRPGSRVQQPAQTMKLPRHPAAPPVGAIKRDVAPRRSAPTCRGSASSRPCRRPRRGVHRLARGKQLICVISIELPLAKPASGRRLAVRMSGTDRPNPCGRERVRAFVRSRSSRGLQRLDARLQFIDARLERLDGLHRQQRNRRPNVAAAERHRGKRRLPGRVDAEQVDRRVLHRRAVGLRSSAPAGSMRVELVAEHVAAPQREVAQVVGQRVADIGIDGRSGGGCAAGALGCGAISDPLAARRRSDARRA